MSRYDYADPGCDPDYCNGLSDDPFDGPTCLWCNDPIEDGHLYCPDRPCAVLAELDSIKEVS